MSPADSERHIVKGAVMSCSRDSGRCSSTPNGAQKGMMQFAFPVKFSEFAFLIDQRASYRRERAELVLEALGHNGKRIAKRKWGRHSVPLA